MSIFSELIGSFFFKRYETLRHILENNTPETLDIYAYGNQFLRELSLFKINYCNTLYIYYILYTKYNVNIVYDNTFSENTGNTTQLYLTYTRLTTYLSSPASRHLSRDYKCVEPSCICRTYLRFFDALFAYRRLNKNIADYITGSWNARKHAIITIYL